MKEKGLKVLIVEDSLLILERINNILLELDFVSEIAQIDNGANAIAKVYENDPDVILLDINLPGKSGISILKEIKNMSSAKVVMVTNYSDQYYRTLCTQLGADHFLDKSADFEKIPALLNIINGDKNSVVVSMTEK